MIFDRLRRKFAPPQYRCTYCNNNVTDDDVLFRCLNDDCVERLLDIEEYVNRFCGKMPRSSEDEVARQVREEERVKKVVAQGRTVFKPPVYQHKVACPHCSTDTHIKICEHCLYDLPSVLESTDTVTIVGMRGSGKTCYTVALVDTLSKSVARNFRSGVRFEDAEGERYFLALRRQIQKDGIPPGATEKAIAKHVQAQSIRITATFPLSRGNVGRHAVSNGEVTAPSLVFHDPAGEWFKRDHVHQTTFLGNSRSILFLVDPYALSDFKPAKPSALDTELDDPQVALASIVDRLRAHLNLAKHKKIPKDLAVVITKADAGVFGTGASPDQFSPLKSPYNPETAQRIGRLCKDALNDDRRLNAPNIVNEAINNFTHVEFFAVSALGESVGPDNRIEPGRWKPKRVEDPFLWIMHRWGIL